MMHGRARSSMLGDGVGIRHALARGDSDLARRGRGGDGQGDRDGNSDGDNDDKCNDQNRRDLDARDGGGGGGGGGRHHKCPNDNDNNGKKYTNGYKNMDAKQATSTSSSGAREAATGAAATIPQAPREFSPVAAGFIGAVLSFVVVSAVIWSAYFFVRRRRARRGDRTSVADALPPDFYAASRPVLITPLPFANSNQSTATLRSFVSAARANDVGDVAREKDATAARNRDVSAAASEDSEVYSHPNRLSDSGNPFVRPNEAREVDPFTAPFEWKAADPEASAPRHPSHTLSA